MALALFGGAPFPTRPNANCRAKSKPEWAVQGCAARRRLWDLAPALCGENQHRQQGRLADGLADHVGKRDKRQEGEKEQREENERNALGDDRDVGQPERPGDERDDQENDRISELGRPPGGANPTSPTVRPGIGSCKLRHQAPASFRRSAPRIALVTRARSGC
jgi:hypothetical protein